MRRDEFLMILKILIPVVVAAVGLGVGVAIKDSLEPSPSSMEAKGFVQCANNKEGVNDVWVDPVAYPGAGWAGLRRSGTGAFYSYILPAGASAYTVTVTGCAGDNAFSEELSPVNGYVLTCNDGECKRAAN